MVNALDLLHIKGTFIDGECVRFVHIKGTFIDGECVRFVAYKRYIY